MNVENGTVELDAFTFECGRTIPLEVAYETYGTYTGDNAVLACHALTGSQHATAKNADSKTDGDSWWHELIGPGRAIDTDEYFVVCVNVPGSCYGTTGPASEAPDGEPYGLDFPRVSVTDWTNAQRRALDELGIDTLHAVVGGSVGGMNVLEWLKRYPDDVDRAIPLATAARLNPQSLALNAIARRGIMTDPCWNGGRYYDDEPPVRGLGLARQIGHVMYLSISSMEEKFGRRESQRDTQSELYPEVHDAELTPYREVESYLDYNAEKMVERFDANSFLYLTSAMDNYDLSKGYESDSAAVEAFDGEVLVFSFTGDWHFPVQQSRELTAALRDAGVRVEHRIIDSGYGHDAFLVETDEFASPVERFVESGLDAVRRTDTERPS